MPTGKSQVTTNLAATAGTQVYTGAAYVSLANLTPAAATATLAIHDGTSTGDPKVLTLQALASGGSVNTGGASIYCKTGVFVVVVGAGAEAQIGIE